jgi:hypothetical protein
MEQHDRQHGDRAQTIDVFSIFQIVLAGWVVEVGLGRAFKPTL